MHIASAVDPIPNRIEESGFKWDSGSSDPGRATWPLEKREKNNFLNSWVGFLRTHPLL